MIHIYLRKGGLKDMSSKMGFKLDMQEQKTVENTNNEHKANATVRKSVVHIFFAEKNKTLAYYNDAFNLYRGDLVYVDGKFEGLLGRVVAVNYNFKIKLSEYKRVIEVIDTNVHGCFYMAGSHFVTFDDNALTKSKASSWFRATDKDGEEFVSGSDDTTFCLDDLKGLMISELVAERGHEYYLNNKVRYLCIDGTKGYAIVEGRRNYEVEFVYQKGEISRLTCSCFCSYNCKHIFAVMLQLKDVLGIIENQYEDKYKKANYFAAICKETLFEYAMMGKESGGFVLQ